MPMQKYTRPQKRSVKSSIPLSNPRNVAWYLYGDKKRLEGKKPNPREGITADSFKSPNTIYGVSRIEDKPKCVLMHTMDIYVTLRMYWLGSKYWFVETNTLTKKVWTSSTIDGRTEAMRVCASREFRWISWQPLRGGD